MAETTGKWLIERDGQSKRISVIEDGKSVEVRVTDSVKTIPANYDSASWEHDTLVKVTYFRRGPRRWAQVVEKV